MRTWLIMLKMLISGVNGPRTWLIMLIMLISGVKCADNAYK